jgi:hypothetical protein
MYQICDQVEQRRYLKKIHLVTELVLANTADPRSVFISSVFEAMLVCMVAFAAEEKIVPVQRGSRPFARPPLEFQLPRTLGFFWRDALDLQPIVAPAFDFEIQEAND